MAKIMFTAFMADARGKVAGTVFSRNRGGAYTRTKVTPNNPQTSYQTAVRQRLANLAASFKALTLSQINSWNTAVDNFISTNVFGNSYRKTGLQLFIGLNSIRQILGQTNLTTPPLPQSVEEVTVTIATLNSTTFDIDLSSLPNTRYYMIEATANQSPGKNFFKNQYRLIDFTVGTGSAISGYDLLPAYTAKFGAPVTGQKISLRVKVAVTATGQTGVPVMVTDTVA